MFPTSRCIEATRDCTSHLHSVLGVERKSVQHSRRGRTLMPSCVRGITVVGKKNGSVGFFRV